MEWPGDEAYKTLREKQKIEGIKDEDDQGDAGEGESEEKEATTTSTSTSSAAKIEFPRKGSEFSMQSVGRLHVTLPKAGEFKKWGKLTAKGFDKPKNSAFWWDMHAKYEKELKSDAEAVDDDDAAHKAKTEKLKKKAEKKKKKKKRSKSVSKEEPVSGEKEDL